MAGIAEIVLGFIVVLHILCAIDIYRDSRKRAYGFVYPILGLLLSVLGLVIYRFVFRGNVALAVRPEPEQGKISQFYRFGVTFLILGSIFLLAGSLMQVGVITGDATGLQSVFLVFAGVFTALMGALFMRYKTRKKTQDPPSDRTA